MKDKIINFRYVFYPFLAFFLGIVVSRKLFAGDLETILLVVGLFAVTFGILIYRKAYKPLIVMFACFLVGNGFFFLGMTSFDVKEYSSKVAVVGRVSDDITDYGYYHKIILDEVKINGKSQNKITLNLKNCDEVVKVGDIFAFESEVEKVKAFSLGNFNSTYLRSGVRYSAEVRYKDVVVSDGYVKFDESVRLAVKNQLYSHMSEKNAGISYAVLFGDKTEVDETVMDAYKLSGIIHVLTVSGLHVGFLISLVYFLLKLCRANKYVRFIVTTVFIFFYAYLCGFTPSVMRAGIMAIVLMLSKLLMRRYDSLNSLGTAGFCICLFSPLTALDMGFQMSFFCVAGILILSPTLTKVFAKFISYKIASLLALSISAQIGIMPILANFSVSVNILSVFANLIVVPAFSIIYPFLFLISMLSTFIPFLGHLLLLADYAFVAVNAVAIFFGTTNLYIGISPFKRAISALYFIALFAVGKFIMAKSLYKFFAFCILSLVLTVTLGIYLIPAKAENSIYFIGNKTSKSIVLENDDGERLAVGDGYWLNRYQSAYDITKIEGFVALDYLGEEDAEVLFEKGVQTLFGDWRNQDSPNMVVLEQNSWLSLGGFKIKFVAQDGTTLGVNISFDHYNIFVAREDKIDYNSHIMKEISPNIVFDDGLTSSDDFLLITQKGGGDYSLTQDGNFKLLNNGDRWIKRGID